MTLYLSKLQIARDPQVAALGALLDPNEGGAKMDAHHRLIWSAFAGDPDAKRDFLWRADGNGRFLVLSHRPPQPTPFFDPPQTKEFAPDLRAGDRLGFVLRVNATRTEKTGERTASGKERKRHIDLVMDALPPKGPDRADRRMEIAGQVARTWLDGQGSRRGFAPDQLTVEDYAVQRFAKGRGQRPVTFGVLDLSGQLRVTDPAAFLTTLSQGLGRAKAFGCGLMLIRRA
ncbi:CRISPR system Cascade subunit CasE [Aliiroseovarius crassostreae]|uniref:CRISPR-associated protein Cse3 n=1 Tax=Aliiroseovarius crassostreae TaxID=154981 RepID=A0A0P7KL12_9RHOB|nr:type I-E CRISPR-associated protein Cas6/Cse3/CasE [Aliiroseovarius crassostreae]KPN62646.1 CRISPR-associated protein Cse3 [Aliiroseovarius crassostreae]SFU96178.1 CRISPR system Cascade subunit CasE [Aliiroseovarius crassostreae]